MGKIAVVDGIEGFNRFAGFGVECDTCGERLVCGQGIARIARETAASRGWTIVTIKEPHPDGFMIERIEDYCADCNPLENRFLE